MIIKRLLNLFSIARSAHKVRRSSSEKERFLAQQALARVMADTRGISMKIGQLFSELNGSSAFQELVEGVEPFPLKQMLPILEQDLRVPVKKVFRSIDKTGFAASLGQVHLAILQSGEKVAVKIRYPGIDKAIETELTLAGLLPGMGPVKQWGFDLEAYKVSLTNNMLRELDYRSEAERQINFSRHVFVDGLNIPTVYEQLSSQRVLVQSRASGRLIHQIIDWPKTDRKRIGKILLTTLFKSLFITGEVHGDPHAGNVFYDYDDLGNPVVSLLDYGCTITIAEDRRLALLKLIVACRLKQSVSPMDCFAAIGFDVNKLGHIEGALILLSQYLFEPFLIAKPLKPSDWQLEKNITELLGEKRWWFRSAGPADLFLLMRAFQGLLSQLDYLQVRLDWWDVLHEALGNSLIEQAVDYELTKIHSGLVKNNIHFSDQAEKLCVEVTDKGKKTVAVTLPAEAVLEIEQLMPSEVSVLIAESNTVDLQGILDGIRRDGIMPQSLFELYNEGKCYKVWLE
ncbi:MAG: ABC transporter [Methylococcaceae bacterium]|nr:ABC transporter [Methylococcaceae bacterium]